MRTKLSLGHVGKVMPLLDDHNKAALKAMRQVRDYSANTCAGSRHAERGVRPDVERVDAVMRAVYAMLRSAPNFDGRIGDVERAIWAAVEGARQFERERMRELVHAVRDANSDAQCDGTFRMLTPGQEHAWVALMDALEEPNVRGNADPTARTGA